MAKTNAVIIKRIKKSEHPHHGGAWKVAYADFVTAMMAFFLLLWLLNATTDAQKRGIADYFSPTLATKSLTSGAGGVLGGRTMTEPGSQANPSSPPAVAVELNQPPDIQDSDDDTPGKVPNPYEADANAAGDPNAAKATPKPNEFAQATAPEKLSAEDRAMLAAVAPGAVDLAHLTDQQFQALKAAREERQFKKAEFELHQAIQSVPDLQPLAENLVVERTSEGLRIQLVDQDKTAMFPLGSAEPDEAARKLMALIGKVVDKMPNQISISGHTDSTPYRGADYDNYDLSVDRARAMRHQLLNNGMSPDRVATVQGKGATEPFLPKDPTAPVNRRVSIVLLREYPMPVAPKGAAPSTPVALPALPAPGPAAPAPVVPIPR